MRIGFIGLGIMGSRMARNLLAAGQELVVYNRTAERMVELVEAGAVPAGSPAEVGEGADIVVTMLADPEAVVETVLGEDGLLGGMKSGALWIDCSTLNPSFSRAMAVEAEQYGVRTLDAPVAGSLKPAADGTLSFFVGGHPDDVAEAGPLFDIMGSKTLHIGDHGMGTAHKLVVNMMLASSMALFAEAIAFGVSMGFDEERLRCGLIGAPVTAPFLALKEENFRTDTYDPAFPLRLTHKDLHMVAQTAYENGVPMPVTAAVREVYQGAMAEGLGDADFSVLYRGGH